MKRLWIINHYAQEPGAPGGTRHYSLARHLTQQGWRATVIAASTELNTGRQRLARNESRRIDVIDGVPFLWIRTPQYRGNGASRLINMLVFSLRVLLPRMTRELDRPDVIIGSSVHPFAAWSGAILARRFGVPFLFEVRDLWPQTLIDMGRLRAGAPFTRFLRWLERWLYRRADRIIVLLPNASNYIVPLGIPAEKIVWIPNGVELAEYPPPEPPAEKDAFVLMYFGAHGEANGLDCVLRAMDELQRRPPQRSVRLRLIGDGALKPALVQLARELGLENIVFEDPVAKQAIPGLARDADGFVFNLIDAPVFKYGISSNKLFDFLAAGRPIVFSCSSSNNPVGEAGAGLTVPPGNPVVLADAIRSLIAMPGRQRDAMGQAGRRYVEDRHSFDVLGAQLAATLEQVQQPSNAKSARIEPSGYL